jgi:ribosome-associated protein
MAKKKATAPAPKRPATPRLPAMVRRGVTAALDKKAGDAVVLDLRKSPAFTDFFIILTGRNVRQVQAIADAIQRALRDKDEKPSAVEGYRRAEWILIDYFDFIFHVFTPATRDFYALEKLWADARRIEIPAD